MPGFNSSKQTAAEKSLVTESLRELNQVAEWRALRPRQKRFLSAMARCDLCVVQASRLSGVGWRQHYEWLKDSTYQAGMDIVDKIMANALLSTMLGDAVRGREVPITHRGMVTGSRREIYPQERIKLLQGFDKRFADSAQFAFAGPTQLNIGYSSKPVEDEPVSLPVPPVSLPEPNKPS